MPVIFPITLELKFVVGAWATVTVARREVTRREIMDSMLMGWGRTTQVFDNGDKVQEEEMMESREAG